MNTIIRDGFACDLSDLRTGSQLEEYGRFQQHLVLLEDEMRLYAFGQAIRLTMPKDYVIDVGSGTGVLGLMALKQGYGHAIMIEPSRKMCRYIEHMLQLNGMEDRATIINSTLEAVDLNSLPEKIGLVVTETISTVIAGFGSWDYLPKLMDRLEDGGRVIPERGTVYGYLCSRPQCHKHDDSGGMRLLHHMGIKTDLFKQAFRSYGNIYNKENAQPDGAEIFELVRFNVQEDPAMQLLDAEAVAHETGAYTGITTYFEITLDAEHDVGFSSMDPRLSSWYPYYIPFAQPVHLTAGERLPIKLALENIDSPYTYAFQLVSNDRPLSRLLYW